MPKLKYTAIIDDKADPPVTEERFHDISVIKNGEYILSGMLANFDMTPLYSIYSHITPSRHLTIVFNMFVWL